jgi:outer membrane protein OmpA-like peptidoglycan-associated protein
MPTLPQSAAAPATPEVAPTPPNVEAPNPPHPPAAEASNNAAPVPLVAPPAAAPAQPPAPPAAPTTNNAAASSAPPAPTQLASAASIGGALNTVKFAAGAVDLPSGSQAMLNTVAAKLMADDTLRVQLIAHASGTADQAMEARRVSLARAVAVRAYLIDKGVRSLRMDVRALGNRSDDGPPGDQVDLLIVSQ